MKKKIVATLLLFYIFIVDAQYAKTFYGHSNDVNDILLLNDTLFSVSDDSTVRMWDIGSGKVKTIHYMGAPCNWVRHYGDYLFIATRDDIQQWNMDLTKNVSTFLVPVHSNRMFDNPGIFVNDKYLIATNYIVTDYISYIITLHFTFWDIKTGIMKKRFKIEGLQFDSSIFISNSSIFVADKTNVKEYDMENFEIKALHCGPMIRKVLVRDGILFCVNKNNIINLWDIKTRNLIKTHYSLKNFIFYSFFFLDDLLFVASDTTILQVNLTSDELIRAFNGHRSFVTKISVYKNRLYSSSRDNTIKEWDIIPQDNTKYVHIFAILSLIGLYIIFSKKFKKSDDIGERKRLINSDPPPPYS